jgi:hypothetical protein
VLFDLLSTGAVARVVHLVMTSVHAFRGRVRGGTCGRSGDACRIVVSSGSSR